MPEDIYTSTLHARLFRHNEQLWVEDLGSTNGTYVNSERIAKAVRLGKGDMLQVGSTVFEVSR
jgi:pSer/pThr/pTyr-binding forkhead associated (FHA) protein